MSRLDEIIAAARTDVERRRVEVPPAALRDLLGTRSGARPFSEALVRPGISVVAEFKRRSPSSGWIDRDATVSDLVAAYERGGAAALSVLTDASSFGGSLDDLREARRASHLPILRKDFVVDPYQLLEAATGGADAVLLIVAALDDAALAGLYAEARQLDLDCLVEVHDEEELERALDLDCDVIGINNRNLRDLSVDIDTTHRLMTDVPIGKTIVAESGFTSRAELDELDRIGVDAVLIGETLMRSSDPAAAVHDLAGYDEETREHYLENPGER